MDRRTFLVSSLRAATFSYAWPALRCLAAGRAAPEPALLVIDCALPLSVSYGALRRGECARSLIAAGDAGTLWHAWLSDWPGRAIGVLRPSDCFVLRNLSIAHGRDWQSTIIDSPTTGNMARSTALAFEIGAVAPASRQ
ncbi:hypothetical protein [Trinickia dabaoshanensis]|uniref:hypothetical protein n=1 Tax=Trinickia dabaoshanensis TaxID=564714 RepID=UPI0011AF5A9F|nr:hypothetical protein [Trinickia dabaoshanensis]